MHSVDKLAECGECGRVYDRTVNGRCPSCAIPAGWDSSVGEDRDRDARCDTSTDD